MEPNLGVRRRIACLTSCYNTNSHLRNTYYSSLLLNLVPLLRDLFRTPPIPPARTEPPHSLPISWLSNRLSAVSAVDVYGLGDAKVALFYRIFAHAVLLIAFTDLKILLHN